MMRTHTTTFLIERGVENTTEAACRVLLDGMNSVFAETERRFEFGALKLVDQIPTYFPGSPSNLPRGDVPMWIWIRRGDRVGSGNMGIGDRGEGICRMASPRVFGPGESDWANFRHVPMHEDGHINGLSMGDHVYKMANVSDATGVAPIFGITITSPADDYWAAHADLKIDPMFNPVDEPRWCELHRRILLGEYRIPHRMVPVPLDIYVMVLDAFTGQPVVADVFVFDCDMDNEDWRLVHYQHHSDFAVKRWENESYQSTQGATLVKAYAPGYLPACFWWSIGDAQMDTLNGRSPTITLRMTPAAPEFPPPWLGSTSNSHVDLAALVPGEHYLVSVLDGGGMRPVKSFQAATLKQRVEFDFQPTNFFSVIHLAGVRLTQRGLGMEPAQSAHVASRPWIDVNPLCERCAAPMQVGKARSL